MSMGWTRGWLCQMSPSPAMRLWTSMGNVSRLVAKEAGRRECLETTVQVKGKFEEEIRRR